MPVFATVFVIAIVYIILKRVTNPPRQDVPDDEPDKW